MDASAVVELYQELQRYVGWTESDAVRVCAVRALLSDSLAGIIDDFYEEVTRHPQTHRVITGGPAQVARLKKTLLAWIEQLFIGDYDKDYIIRRWQVGRRHAEIGLDQVFTNVALSRVRGLLLDHLHRRWKGSLEEFAATAKSLNRLLDLDLAIIEDAYHDAYVFREKQIERLATLGKMAGGIAHELRNPLNVIRTSSYYLQQAPDAPAAKRGEHLERIARQTTIADRVITALSDFARLPLPEFLTVKPGVLLSEVLAEQECSGQVVLQVDCPETLPAMRGDGRQLAIVFSNLVRNACDAMPNGGTLTIQVAAVGDQIEWRISDTGCGIAPEELFRVFDPFYSTKTRGIGLGLSICRSIIETHEGRIAVESQPGAGTTFTVCLPRVDKPSATRVASPTKYDATEPNT
ncbi:MAG: Globin-coupled histidine kinase [Planctomycetota bacterium]